jgi:hypothetical protein
LIFVRVGTPIPQKNTVTLAPENDKYGADITYGGTARLGALPIGSGTIDYPGDAYVCATEMVATVTGDDVQGSTFRFQRSVVENDWAIAPGTPSGGTPTWDVSLVHHYDSTFTQETCPSTDDNTPSETSGNMYGYDNSGLNLGIQVYSANPTYASFARRTYAYAVKKFTYKVQMQEPDGTWKDVKSIVVFQDIIARKVQKTGVVSADWVGVENDYSYDRGFNPAGGSQSLRITTQTVGRVCGLPLLESGFLYVNIPEDANPE